MSFWATGIPGPVRYSDAIQVDKVQSDLIKVTNEKVEQLVFHGMPTPRGFNGPTGPE